MKLDIPYGKDSVSIDIPDENIAEVIRPNEVEVEDESSIIKNAINNPMNSKGFEEFLSDAKDVLFIVNDGTRDTPTAEVLHVVYDKIKDKNLKFLIATGTHRAPTEEEYRLIFGHLLGQLRERIHVHDAKKEKDMVYLGKTSRGTMILLNRLCIEADKIVAINSVKPHYFSGFTGGRKSFVPGIASYKTIEMNHSHAVSEASQSMALKGNPVAEDMDEAVGFLKSEKIFSIQTVLTGDHRLYAAFAGDLFESFDRAIKMAEKLFFVPLKEGFSTKISKTS